MIPVLLLAMGLVAAGLGVPSGVVLGHWVVTVAGCLFTLTIVPMMWSSQQGEGTLTPTAWLAVRHGLLAAGLVAAVLVVVTGEDRLSAVGLALFAAGVVVRVIGIDVVEARKRRAARAEQVGRAT